MAFEEMRFINHENRKETDFLGGELDDRWSGGFWAEEIFWKLKMSFLRLRLS